MFRTLLIIVVLLLAGGVGVVYADSRFPNTPVVKDMAPHLRQLAGHVPPVDTSKVLGVASPSASEIGSLPKRAFEYSRYQYCQVVIDEYESKHDSKQ
jgi:hypothetical protein